MVLNIEGVFSGEGDTLERLPLTIFTLSCEIFKYANFFDKDNQKVVPKKPLSDFKRDFFGSFFQ